MAKARKAAVREKDEDVMAEEVLPESQADDAEEQADLERTPDPSLGLYLQEMGRIALLTRDQEEQLGIDMETARGLQMLLAQRETPGRGTGDATAIALSLFRRVSARRRLVHLLAKRARVATDAWSRAVFDPLVRRLIDTESDPEVLAWIAEGLEMEPEAAQAEMVRLSIDTRLLPPPLLMELEGLADGPDGELEEALQAWGPALQQRWQTVLQRGDRAKAHLTEANLRLVVSVAHKFANRGLPFVDLVQEGNMGLLRAVRGYDYRRGRRFSTYAIWWIRQSMGRALASQVRSIRLPIHVQEEIRKVRWARQAHEQEQGTPALDRRIVAITGLSPQALQRLDLLAQETVSLDRALSTADEEEVSLQSFLQDDSQQDPVEKVFADRLEGDVHRALAELPPRERRAIELRFGFDCQGPQTLEVVGRELGVTRERARQILRRTLRRLRHCPGLEELERDMD